MEISYKDYNEDLDVINNVEVSPMEKYSIEIDGEIKKPGALKVLDILDKDTSFEEKAEFVKEMLLGCKVTVKENGKKLFDVCFTPGMQWWAVRDFDERPFALKYVISVVYTRFLKNCIA